jgi:hypothetical protein
MNIKFFKGRSNSFISWMCPLLKPQFFDLNEFIHTEGDEIHDIHFLVDGQCCFVLPSFNNQSYIEIKIGNYFGISDIIGSLEFLNV